MPPKKQKDFRVKENNNLAGCLINGLCGSILKNTCKFTNLPKLFYWRTGDKLSIYDYLIFKYSKRKLIETR